MKFLVEEPTYSLHSKTNQEQIEYLQKNQLSDDKDPSSSSIDALQNVLANTFFPNHKSDNSFSNYLHSSLNEKQFHQFCSSLSKRIHSYSLSQHSTVAITATTSFSEEPTNSIDYENTYLSSEDTSRIDDSSSLTTITSNLPTTELDDIQQNTSVYSDTTILNSDIDEISEEITSDLKQYKQIDMRLNLPNSNISNNDEEIDPEHLNITTPDYQFTGLVHAIKYTVIKESDDDDEQTLSDYDNVSDDSEHNKKIRSNADMVSLNSSMTSTMQCNHCPMMFIGEQLNKQEQTSTSEDDGDDDDYIIIDQQNPIVQLTMMNNESEFETEDDEEYDQHLESIRLFDNEPLNANFSDQSAYSDETRYSSDVIRNNRTSDHLNNTSSTLREEAISITKVRCKQRNTWIRSSTSFEEHPTKLIKPFLTKTSVDGTDADFSCPNITMNLTTCGKTAATMLLHKNSVDDNKTEKKNGDTSSYGFLQLNHDLRSIKTDESIVSPLLKTNSTRDKDALSTSKKTDNFYLIHHQSSLIPIKDLLNQNINTNIEIIEMDEQECILEIVDGVVTLVPKDKSFLSITTTNSDEEKSEEKQKNSIEYETSHNYDSPKRTERSSSIASSISTPSLSEHEPEQEPDHDEISPSSSSSSSLSRSSSNKEENKQAQEPFILQRDIPSKSPPLHSHTEQSTDLLDLFSTPPVPSSNSNTDTNNNNNKKYTKNLLDDSLSSVSSYENNNPNNNSSSDSSEREKIRSSSPQIENRSNPSSPSIPTKDDLSPLSPSNQTSVPLHSISTVEKPSSIDETEIDYPIPKSEPPPAAKPINKARLNEFASLLSSSAHLIPPQVIKKPETPKTTTTTNRPLPSPSRSDEQSFSSIRSATSDRDERESYHTVKSNNNSEQDQNKKSIDARYNEKIDDRNSIQINTSNIKALFEQKISDTNKALSQSNEHLLHLIETKQTHHKKAPISYGSLKRNLPLNPQQTNQSTTRRQSYQDISNMNKYTDHIIGAKDVVIEDKQPELVPQTQHYGSNIRRHNTEEILRPGTTSSKTSPESTANGYFSESLIAREIRETQEKEEELRRQRKKCGLPEDVSTLLTLANNDPLKSDMSSAKPPVKSSSFLSNLDFFTTKQNNPVNGSTSPRRSTTTISAVVYDSHGTSTPDECKQTNNVVSQELNRFNNSGIPIIRTSSTNNFIHRSSSNQNVHATQNTNNIIQREIEAIRAKEAELRQLGRIQHTSDEHSDPRKYQEYVPTLSKSQSSNTLSTGRTRRETEKIHRPIIATSNGFLQPKPMNNNLSLSSIRGKFPSPNPTAPIISSSNKSTDYSKLSSTDRLELEKRECQEREQELKKQRHSTIGANSSVNGDSGNASQDEHDDDQERYFDKIERLKRKENEKAQAPLIRPTKKLDMSQRWEQMMTNKTVPNSIGDDNNNNNNNDDDD